MGIQSSSPKLLFREIAFQIGLHLVVFVFYSFDHHHESVKTYQVVFFLNYVAAAAFFNYWLIPRFFYTKRYLAFFAYAILTIVAVVAMEELVLEQIYFPNTRAKAFPGVMHVLFDVLPVITILSGFKFAWDALVKQRQVEDLQMAVQESELQFLKSQINPHFLFNNLNNLYAHAIENSPKTPGIILELSGVLRYMLYECKEQYVPLVKEVEQLKNFVQLSELQIEGRGQVNFSTENIQSGYQIAPLILMVFIENAFKHSTASQSDQIVIDLHLELDREGWLIFICKNSYRPQSNTDKLSKGIGLENVRKRLQLLYPNSHRLDIQKKAQEYEVLLSLQLHQTVPS